MRAIDSLRWTTRSWPVPMSCKVLPTFLPLIMMTGVILVGGEVAMAETLDLKVEAVVVGEMEKESKVAIYK